MFAPNFVASSLHATEQDDIDLSQRAKEFDKEAKRADVPMLISTGR